jgi:hypothetical protein
MMIEWSDSVYPSGLFDSYRRLPETKRNSSLFLVLNVAKNRAKYVA